MEFLEKDLEEIIFTSKREELEFRGLSIRGKIFRQLRIGKYGVADLVTIERERVFTENQYYNHSLIITVYELKKDKIGISAFLQALEYIQGIKRYLYKRGFFKNVMFRIVLIGKTISKNSSFIYLSDLLEDHRSLVLENYTYSITINGLSFNYETGYKLIDEGF